jgi:uncharacterized protein (TIGR00255 family)
MKMKTSFISSMTGFGKGSAVCSANGLRFTVEIAAVNRKQLEVRASLSRELAGYEPLLRKLVSDKISRGSINVRAEVVCDENIPAATVKINHALIETLVTSCRGLQEKFSLSGSLELRDILQVPGVIETVLPDIHLPEMEQAFSAAVNQALSALLQMRHQEGSALLQDLTARLSKLQEIVSKIEPELAGMPAAFREKLRERLKFAKPDFSVNEEVLLREMIIYADRADVTEELVRLKSHFLQFDHFLAGNEPCPGRSLDFLVQEVAREITTLGNKATGCQISPLVVSFKAELEKIREQIQNIE